MLEWLIFMDGGGACGEAVAVFDRCLTCDRFKRHCFSHRKETALTPLATCRCPWKEWKVSTDHRFVRNIQTAILNKKNNNAREESVTKTSQNK